MIVAVMMILLCTVEASYILPDMTGFLPFHPLTTFVWVCVSFQNTHQFVKCHHHLPVLAMPHPTTRQRILFCLLIHRGIPIQNKVGILSHYLSWHAPSNSNSSFPLYGLLPSKDGPYLIMGFSLLKPLFPPSIDLLAFLPAIPLFLLWCYLIRACQVSFGSAVYFPFYLITVAQYYHCACIHATSGFLDLFHCLWASFAHFFLLGHPRPISFPWASSVHSNYTFTWAFANYFGLLRPNFHILYFWGSWAIYQPLTYFITSGLLWPILTFHTVHEFTTSFFGLLFLLSLRPIYYFLSL